MKLPFVICTKGKYLFLNNRTHRYKCIWVLGTLRYSCGQEDNSGNVLTAEMQ